MKKIIVLFLLAFFLFPNTAFANGAGLPAFFQINDKYAISNPLQSYGITASTFLIPQDFAPENYVVNEPIQFNIDQKPLTSVIPKDLMDTTKFSWDFGDGTKAEGLSNSHTYTKSGSYILVLTINIYSSDAQIPTQFIDSFLINIIPNKDFNKLPKAYIKINGDEVHNPLDTNYKTNFGLPTTLDASNSKDEGGKIIEYLWNFGDGETSTKQSDTHLYKQPPYERIVVLRVKDDNGYISDTFADLRHDPSIQNTPGSTGALAASADIPAIDKKNESQKGPPYLIIGVVVVGLLTGGWYFLKKKSSESPYL